MNIDKSTRDSTREVAASANKKKPYKTPSLRFEPVFEVSALACGKILSTSMTAARQQRRLVARRLERRSRECVEGRASWGVHWRRRWSVHSEKFVCASSAPAWRLPSFPEI